MPRRRSKKSSTLSSCSNSTTGSVLSQKHEKNTPSSPIQAPKPILNSKTNLETFNDENLKPSNNVSTLIQGWSSDAAALHDELNLFRQKWKSELDNPSAVVAPTAGSSGPSADTSQLREPVNSSSCDKSSEGVYKKKLDAEQIDAETYEKAKKLFMIAVQLEQDEMHYDSIKYYKQAMHLCPDIEKLTFREQSEASAALAAENSKQANPPPGTELTDAEDEIPLYIRICESFNSAQKEGQYQICRPASKVKNIHISHLPNELILQIFRYVIGEDLDLASLETLGRVCRGFYIISREQALWRSICYNTWSDETSTVIDCWKSSVKNRVSSNPQIDWRQLFIEQPRVNHDGVYISRTRYIRQGDVDFQDLIYRPFHVIHYYRYFRFFPDRKVLILTTNEEPDRIIPIFRHATHSKHFSPDLSILTGTFELTSEDQVLISAEKVYCPVKKVNRRGVQSNSTRQTPLSQKFNLKFQLKTVEHKPYKNNVLKWLNYTIVSRMDTGLEVTNFDLTPETFPNLTFCRVKKLSLKLTSPLF